MMKIALGDKWRLYQRTAPENFEMLGVINISGIIGALARSTTTGQYVRLNDGAVCSLDQRQVRKALDAAADKPVCEVCGEPAPAATRCTNHRCAKCHAQHCSEGGATSPGHGRGAVATPFARRS